MPNRKLFKYFISQKAAVYLIFCLLPRMVSISNVPLCKLQRDAVSGFSRDGHILIGGTFPVHTYTFHDISFTTKPMQTTCHVFTYEYYKWLQSMVFAIESINSNPDILPNITLGFRIYDSCMVTQRSLKGTLWILTGQKEPIPNYQCYKNHQSSAIVGDATSTRSGILARILGLYRYPQISYSASLPLLSDRTQFPSFFRTISNDNFQFPGLVQLVKHFGWTWVGLLADDDDYGQLGIQIMQKEIDKTSVCVAFIEYILKSHEDRNAVHITEVIKSSTAKVIVVFSTGDDVVYLLNEMVRQNISDIILVASEGWSTSTFLSVETYSNIMTGTIGFSIYSEEMPGFKEHLNHIHPSKSPDDIFIREFWGNAFGCNWLDQTATQNTQDNNTLVCTGKETLENLYSGHTDISSLTFNIYNAVYAIATALHDLSTCKPGRGPFIKRTCADINNFQPWQLLYYVKHMRLPGQAGMDPYFDQDGNPPARYDIVNWHRSLKGTTKPVKVGTYDPSALPREILTINVSALRWASDSKQVPTSVCSPDCPPGYRKAAIEGQPICCFKCVQCAQGEISNQTNSIECSKCPWDQWPNYEGERCISKILEFLSYKEPLGATLAAASIILSTIAAFIFRVFIRNRNTPIVKANNRSLSYLLLLSITLCFLCALAFIGYPTKEKCLLRQVSFGIIFALCVSCIMAKTIMVVLAFNATKPNSDLRRWVGPQMTYVLVGCSTLFQFFICVSWLAYAPPFSYNNIHIKPGMIIVECNEGSPIAFWCMLGYLGVMATISFIVAFLARKLPDSFNEAKYITFSMLAFLSVWISFIPAYLSTQGKYMVAMEIFAILASSSSLLSLIYIPKCYIILVRPEMNTKEQLMGRGQINKLKKV